jgi:hypothetical protein
VGATVSKGNNTGGFMRIHTQSPVSFKRNFGASAWKSKFFLYICRRLINIDMPKVLLYISAKVTWIFLFFGTDFNEKK